MPQIYYKEVKFKPKWWNKESIKKAIFSSYKDPTAYFLVFSNLSTIFFAITQNWGFGTIIWIYWLQSAIIGGFNFFKILSLKEFSVEGFKINNQPVEATEKTKQTTALFFAFHYGLFHFIYAIFLVGLFSEGITNQDALFILSTVAIFFVNHLFSFAYYCNKPKPKQNIGTIMLFPYARIIPMHLTIMFGGVLASVGNFSHIVLLFFMLLKTIADLAMHSLEHAEQQQAGNI